MNLKKALSLDAIAGLFATALYGCTEAPKEKTTLSFHSFDGDVKKMHFWSNDGEAYFRSYQSGMNYVLMAVSAVVIIAALTAYLSKNT